MLYKLKWVQFFVSGEKLGYKEKKEKIIREI